MINMKSLEEPTEDIATALIFKSLWRKLREKDDNDGLDSYVLLPSASDSSQSKSFDSLLQLTNNKKGA